MQDRARVLQALPTIIEALYADTRGDRKNPFKTGLWRSYMHTTLVMGTALIARSSLLSCYCPCVSDMVRSRVHAGPRRARRLPARKRRAAGILCVCVRVWDC